MGLAFVFPGQGSQFIGMGYSLASRFRDFELFFSETIQEADQILGFALSKILKEGPEETLKMTEITQPALLTVSVAMTRWLQNQKTHPQMALGHSLGEYSALVTAGALNFKDALRLVWLRGRLMQSAVPHGLGGMAALIGGDAHTAKKLCDDIQTRTQKVLEIALLNSPSQIVVSGHLEAIQEAVDQAKNFGVRRVVPLEVSGPFHCSLLETAGIELSKALKDILISAPSIPVISNTTALEESTPEQIRENLIAQVSQTVRWEESVRYAIQKGITQFLEVGSGSVLSGLLKKISPNTPSLALEEIHSLDQVRRNT